MSQYVPLNLTLTNTGVTYPLDPTRFVDGGVINANVSGFLTAVNSELNTLNPLAKATYPFTTTALANGGTVTVPLATAANPFTVYRTTGDGTISGATINFPTTGVVDGSTIAFVTTGAVTTVSGTLSSGGLPSISSTAAGTLVKYAYNAAATEWFKV